MKNLYEVFDEFELATNKTERREVLSKNMSKALVEVLQLTFHPAFQWYFDDMPESYKIPDTLPGISRNQVATEIRKMYLFKKGDGTADKLTPQKREQLLLQILESLEPREAEVIIGIFRKDQGVKGLDYKFVKENFDNLLP